MYRRFTIIEILAVMVIISILAGMLLGGASYARRAARNSKTKAQLEMIRSALNSYNQEWGFYPETGLGADADLGAGFWTSLKAPDGQFYLKLGEQGFNFEHTGGVYTTGDKKGRRKPLTTDDTITAVYDPYGQLWRYCVPGTRNTASVDVWSKGLNEVDDSASRDTDLGSDESDDVGNWKRN